MWAESAVIEVFGVMLDVLPLRALVVMIAEQHTPGKDAMREQWSAERCLRWMEDNRQRTEQRIRSIVAVDRDGRYYGDSEAVTGYTMRERAQLFRI